MERVARAGDVMFRGCAFEPEHHVGFLPDPETSVVVEPVCLDCWQGGEGQGVPLFARDVEVWVCEACGSHLLEHFTRHLA